MEEEKEQEPVERNDEYLRTWQDYQRRILTERREKTARLEQVRNRAQRQFDQLRAAYETVRATGITINGRPLAASENNRFWFNDGANDVITYSVDYDTTRLTRIHGPQTIRYDTIQGAVGMLYADLANLQDL